MADWPRAPMLLEINAFAWLNALTVKYDVPVTLGSIPAEEVAVIAGQGFDAVWLMGVWQHSAGARAIAAQLDFFKAEYERALPGCQDRDVAGSPYALSGYTVDTRLGDEAELQLFREQLARHSLRLILDFVPNHFALDHAWTRKHPSRLVQGTPLDLKISPGKYYPVTRGEDTLVFAHGRALYTSVWTDTVQLDYRRRETREAMVGYLLQIAGLCDGVRCDMAMLVLREVFTKTWQGTYEGESQFWEEAIPAVKARYPGFLMIGEVYWDYEYRLQQLGFDFVYDKVLYDRVLGNDPRAVFYHLSGGSVEFQSRLVRFVENHDERRVVELVGIRHSLAAAALVLTLPGLRFFHEGQSDGYRIKLPVQLGRRSEEEPLASVRQFYARLFALLQTPLFRDGEWRLLMPCESSPGNGSYSHIIACLQTLAEEIALVVVNLAPGTSQCFLPLDYGPIPRGNWLLKDLLSDQEYRREGARLAGRGLFLDLPGFGYHVFHFLPVQ